MFTKLIQLYIKHSLNHASIAFDDIIKGSLYSLCRKNHINLHRWIREGARK